MSPQADTPLDGVDIIDGMLDAELVDKVQLGGKATNDLETANHAQVSVPQGALEQEVCRVMPKSIDALLPSNVQEES